MRSATLYYFQVPSRVEKRLWNRAATWFFRSRFFYVCVCYISSLLPRSRDRFGSTIDTDTNSRLREKKPS